MTQQIDYTVNKNQLQPAHLQEWLDSGVDPDIAALNVSSTFSTGGES